MPKKLEPRSLQVLYRDFVLPDQKSRCCACDRQLSTGVAVFLVVDAAPAPFGPSCAVKYCKTKTTGIPDHTTGLTFLRPDESDGESSLSAAKTAANQITDRQRMTAEQKEVARAVLYASLRSSRLPALGFHGLNYVPLEQFLKIYNTGKLDRCLMKAVQTTMDKTAVGTKMQHFSLENLRACYVHAWLLNRVYDETRGEGKRMDTGSYDRWNHLGLLLRKNLFLPPKECGEVRDLAVRFLPVPPDKVNIQFVAAKPPFAPRPSLEKRLET